jgi:hypothetical protein
MGSPYEDYVTMCATPTKLTAAARGPPPPLVAVKLDRAAANISFIINNLFPELKKT